MALGGPKKHHESPGFYGERKAGEGKRRDAAGWAERELMQKPLFGSHKHPAGCRPVSSGQSKKEMPVLGRIAFASLPATPPPAALTARRIAHFPQSHKVN